MRAASMMIVAALFAAHSVDAQDVQALMQKYDCPLCHAADEAKTGPAYSEIAVRYRNDPNAAAKLVAVVRKGAHGKGPWPMPPLPQVAEADARRMVDYILATGK